jgi:hypothetical protein
MQRRPASMTLHWNCRSRDRHANPNIRLADQVQKRTMARLAVEHGLVHVDVDDRAPFSTCWRATVSACS